MPKSEKKQNLRNKRYVEQIWTNNAYRNFNYLIACKESGEAIAIDPLDHRKCLARAKEKGWEITTILNTHEHLDHTGGNDKMIQATGARLIAHENAKDKISWNRSRRPVRVILSESEELRWKLWTHPGIR